MSHYGLSQMVNAFCKQKRQGLNVSLQSLASEHELTPDERRALLSLDWEALARLELHPILKVKLKAATQAPLSVHK